MRKRRKRGGSRTGGGLFRILIQKPRESEESCTLSGILNHSKWLAIFAVLFFALFAEVLLQDRNFIYRDAGHFYYPYFKMIAQQWGSGRIPLWNPFENGGEPLAGNPTSSVFYPLKLLFVLPYPVAYKWYLMGHIVLAFGCCYAAARGFGISIGGAALAAMAYAFSGSVFFQIYNIVFLCGAAWLPLGVLCVDRLVREPSWKWVVGLGAVLALQVLGGDPEIAFVTGLISLPYALYYHQGPVRGTLLLLAAMAIGFGLVQFRLWYPDLVLAAAGKRGWITVVTQRPWYAAAMAGLPAIGIVLIAACWNSLRRQAQGLRTVYLLAAAGGIAFALCAVQVLPTMDLVRVSDRAAPDAPHESVAFSFFPVRLLELLVPAVFGKQMPIYTRWAPFASLETGIWIPSVYFGLAPVLLAVGSFTWRRGSVQSRFFTWLALVMLWASIGKFGGPMWLFDPNLGKNINSARVENPNEYKRYGHSDGLYRILEETVPGFRSFRYPAKMLVVTTLALVMLAGLGWDRLVSGQTFKLAPVVTILCIALGGLLVLVLVGQQLVLKFFATFAPEANSFGPFVAHQAWRDLGLALGQSFAVALTLRAGLAFGNLQTTRWQFALLALVAVDLYLGNHWLVLTDWQEIIDSKPTVVEAIEKHEQKLGMSEPFRVHRTRIYEPLYWRKNSSPDRMVEMSRWERRTIQPKYGLPFGMHYTTTTGTMAIYDVEFFFAPWTVKTPPTLREARPQMPDILVYYPKTGYDIWNTKYFVIPKAQILDDENRGVLTLMGARSGQPLPIVAESPPDKDDFLVLENTEALPRAWIVHRAEFANPIRTLRKVERTVPMEKLLYRSLDAGLPLWRGVDYGDYPIQSQVMLEYAGDNDLRPYQSGQLPGPDETVHFDAYEPDFVQMTARLRTPGFLVLADTFHRGWSARVDGEPTEIIRANRAMRAVPVPAGEHVVTMEYTSTAFQIGAAISGMGWLACGLFAVFLKLHRSS